jgi:hypothetical protein
VEALGKLNLNERVKVGKGVKGEKKEKEEKKEKKEKKAEPRMVLPYCGKKVEEWCEGLKANHGLYSQCTSEKSGEKYCKTCKKQAEKNESGKPTGGEISERMGKSSEAYRMEKGKKCVVYALVMKKLKIEKSEACAEAKKYGLVIPEEEFEMPKSQRGRPKKLSESESVRSDEGEKKGRGRPKKNKTVAEKQTDETDDLIASLVAEANALKGSGGGKGSGAESEAEEGAESEAEEGAESEAEEGTEEESEEGAERESERERLLKQIAEKLKGDEKYNKLSEKVVGKKEKKEHLAVLGAHIKSILTEEEAALYTGAPGVEEIEALEAEEKEAEAEAEKQAKKEAAEAEKKAKKEVADAEKKAKKEAADAEKKAKGEAEKQAKAAADAEKKAEAAREKQAKKEAADAEKQAKKEAAEAEKQAKKPAEVKEKKPVEKKEKKPVEKKEKKQAQVKQAQVKPAEKEKSEELQEDVVESEADSSEADSSEADSSEADPSEAVVNAKVFEFEGKKYLKTEEGILYDQRSEECVGVWNEETKSIDDFADDEE